MTKIAHGRFTYIAPADLSKMTGVESGTVIAAGVMRATETIDLRVEGAAEIAAAAEALDKVEEHVRRALCGVLDRLGADGATAFINGDSPEQLSDAIYQHVKELEDRAMLSTAEFTYECDALCPSAGNADGARCHVKGPHVLHEATRKFTTGWPDHLTQERVKK